MEADYVLNLPKEVVVVVQVTEVTEVTEEIVIVVVEKDVEVNIE
jgi:hypothetical protein